MVEKESCKLSNLHILYHGVDDAPNKINNKDFKKLMNSENVEDVLHPAI